MQEEPCKPAISGSTTEGESFAGTSHSVANDSIERLAVQRPAARCGSSVSLMAQDDIPSLADWLAELRSRPAPTKVVLASYDLVRPIPDAPHEGMAAGQVALDVVRYDYLGWPGTPDAH